MKQIIIGIGLALFLVGCAGFVNNGKKTLYVTATLADGAMKDYAVYWKAQTNKQGDTLALESQRSNVMQLSREVGAGIALADSTLDSYSANVGTNTATKDVVNALITTAVSKVGSFAAYIGSLTGKTNSALTKF